jgi:hypothetical protein
MNLEVIVKVCELTKKQGSIRSNVLLQMIKNELECFYKEDPLAEAYLEK